VEKYLNYASLSLGQAKIILYTIWLFEYKIV